jgi:hypothetical protein
MAGIGCDCDNKGLGAFGDGFKAKANQALNFGKEQLAQAEARLKAERDAIAKAAKDAQASIEAKAKQARDKLLQPTKTIGLSAGRNLFLILIKNNIDGLASKLSTGNTTPLLNKWYELGGDRTILGKALKTGASKPEKKFGLLGKIKKLLKDNNVTNQNINGIGAIPSSVKTAIISVCTLAGTAIASSSSAALAAPIGAGSGATLGEVINQVLPMIIDAVNKVPTTEEVAANAPFNDGGTTDIDTRTNEAPSTEPLKSSKNTMLYIGGAALLATGIYFATKKK